MSVGHEDSRKISESIRVDIAIIHSTIVATINLTLTTDTTSASSFLSRYFEVVKSMPHLGAHRIVIVIKIKQLVTIVS